jgi:hypothetical protein
MPRPLKGEHLKENFKETFGSDHRSHLPGNTHLPGIAGGDDGTGTGTGTGNSDDSDYAADFKQHRPPIPLPTASLLALQTQLSYAFPHYSMISPTTLASPALQPWCK